MSLQEDNELLVAEVERVNAFVGLLVQHYTTLDGEVRIPIGEIEAGLPPESGVHIEWDEEDLIFSIKKISEMTNAK